MCVSKSYGSRSVCALLSIDMKVWELDPHDAADIHKFLEKGKLPERRELKQPYLLHYDAKTRRSYPKVGSCFLCLTREQGYRSTEGYFDRSHPKFRRPIFENYPIGQRKLRIHTNCKIGLGAHEEVSVEHSP